MSSRAATFDHSGRSVVIQQSAGDPRRMDIEQLRRKYEQMRTYKAPPNKRPYTELGYLDLADQLADVASDCDSSLHEVASTTIMRLLDQLKHHRCRNNYKCS